MRKILKIGGIIVIIAMIITGIVAGVGLSKTVFVKHPELKGEPKISKWYRITPKEAKSSDGSEWHGLIRVGSKNKVIVYFFGGGVSINESTSKRGKEFFATTAKIQDFVASGGIGSSSKENPFHDWTILILPYASGDFHSDTGEYHYKDGSKERVVYHNGYNMQPSIY